MTFSILQEVLMPVSFGALLCLMILYWGQAALFSYTRYSKFTTVLFSFSFFLLTTLIILRWLDSGHFPLSNLYESLLFLSWSFLGIQLVAQLTLIRGVQEPALAGYAKPFDFAYRSPAQSPKVSTSTALSNFFDAAPGADRLIASEIEHPPRPVMADFALRELSQRQLLHLLGVITSPMALLTYGFAFLKLPREMQKATALVPALQSNWLMMHVTIMILSYAALLCGSIFSMVFLLLTSLNTSSPVDSAVRLQTVTGTSPAVGAAPTSNTQTTYSFYGRVSAGALHTAGRRHSSLGVGKPLPAADNLKVEPSAGVIPGPTWPELPKICFSDRLELHDWAQRAQTRLGRAVGRTLDVAAAKASLLQELRRRPATSTTSFTQASSALNQQDLELLNNKGQFVGGGLANLLPERTARARQASKDCQTFGLAQAGSGLSRRDLGVIELEENLEKKSSYLDLAERLDNYSYRVLALGFPLLTVGILSGAVWANEAWGSYWSWDPKETWALITWLVFAIYLHARILKGWTGRKPAMIATFGFFVVWFCYLGVNLLGTGLHSYGWFSN